jgi:hypothetical protein
VDPKQQLWIVRLVRSSFGIGSGIGGKSTMDLRMEAVNGTGSVARNNVRAKGFALGKSNSMPCSVERMRHDKTVLIYCCRDQWMRQLHQERTRSTQEKKSFFVDLAGDTFWVIIGVLAWFLFHFLCLPFVLCWHLRSLLSVNFLRRLADEKLKRRWEAVLPSI